MDNPPTFILDTFALLAYLRDEPAASRIEKVLKDAKQGKSRLYLSVINLGEILNITERRGGTEKAQDALALIRQLPVEVLPANEQTVFAAAHVKAHYAISYADAFVVAAVQHTGGAIMTGYPEFDAVKEIVQVEWLPAAD